jgi:hypothetical protein
MAERGGETALAHAIGRAFIAFLKILSGGSADPGPSFDVFAAKTFGNLVREMRTYTFLRSFCRERNAAESGEPTTRSLPDIKVTSALVGAIRCGCCLLSNFGFGRSIDHDPRQCSDLTDPPPALFPLNVDRQHRRLLRAAIWSRGRLYARGILARLNGWPVAGHSRRSLRQMQFANAALRQLLPSDTFLTLPANGH